MFEQIKSRAQIAAEAAAAAAAGKPVTSNPYQPGTDAHAEWRKAWADQSATALA